MRMPKASIAGPVVRRRFTSAKLIHREYASGKTTIRTIARMAGRIRSHANSDSGGVRL